MDSVYYLGGTYLFPPKTIRLEKILMYFKLKCVPGNNPSCGEWDFIAFIFAYKDSVRYELGKFKTPYGFGLNLGDGFTWVYDVSDFRTILYDSVRIEYMVPQTGTTLYEQLDLKFIMIEGTPPRDIIKIENLWYGEFRFGDALDPIDDHFEEITINLLPNVKTSKIRATVVGDGWGGSTGCAEFCSKEHRIDVDGTTRFRWNVWREDCDMNPLYPQGGTWLYNRSNWCPGAEMRTMEFELTPFISASQVKFDYSIEPYIYPEDGQFWPYYSLETQVVSYGLPNFTLDAELVNIVAPSTWEFYNRSNPICNEPIIIIKNNGSSHLTSLKIDYGIEEGGKAKFNWNGNLKFLEKDTISLPAYDMGELIDEVNTFEAVISNPNGGQDEYASNNKLTSIAKKVPYYFNNLILSFQTNRFPENNYHYTIKDVTGNEIYSRTGIQPNSLYKDTFSLADGCYELRFINESGYGIDFWPLRPDYGSGWIKLSNLYRDIKSFNPDFGREIFHQFTVGPKPILVSTTDTLSFAEVKLNEQKDLSFEISPGNSLPLVITKANVIFGTQRGYSVTTNPPVDNDNPVTLNNGEKMFVTVTFKPKKEGSSNTSLIISSNDELYGDKYIRLIGKGIDPNSVDDNDNNEMSLNLAVQPNPVVDNAEITFSAGSGDLLPHAKLSLFNPMGQEIKILYEGKADPLYNKINFTSDDICTGIYFLIIKSENNGVSIPVIILK
ncbi:MAG: hypothetical protein HZB41_02820 [Ignavibacteriae bacterium]|nr:hypothetical protein [Ignavibacteriota bacterium]